MKPKEMVELLDQVLTVLHSHSENGGENAHHIVIDPTTGQLTVYLI